MAVKAQKNVKICDAVPENMTFVENSYGIGVGIGLGLDRITLPTNPNQNLSNAIDGEFGEIIMTQVLILQINCVKKQIPPTLVN